MSRQNKVNPGTYTQAGRLSQDEAAREVKKQREAASPRNTEGGDFSEKQKSQVTEKDKAGDEEETEDSNEE